MLSQKGKIKILITDTAPLHPPMWGGPKRIWNLYSHFPQDLFDMTYAGVNCNLGKDKKYIFNKIQDNFKEISCSLPAHYYLWHVFEKAIFKDNSFDLFPYLWMHTDWQFKYILNSKDADIVVCSHPWSALCINKNKKHFFIYDAHNCEYLLMDRILGKHIFKSLVLRRVKKIEGDACRRSDLILVCSEKEKKDFLDLYKLNVDKIIITANGANISKGNGDKTKKDCRIKLSLSLEDKVIVFIGAYYKPNIDAARFIIRKLSQELKEFKFLIIGTVFDAFKTERMPLNVKLLGWILDEQLDEVLRASDISINPMLDGSGINIKMLDYMSYGLPIVTTECGARGIETDGKQPMMVSTIDDFAENIKVLNSDTQLYKRMSEDGKSLITQRYDWKMISDKLQEVIMERFRTISR